MHINIRTHLINIFRYNKMILFFSFFLFFVKIGLLNGQNLPKEKPISRIQLFNYDSDIKRDTVMSLNYQLFYNRFFRLN